MPGAMIDIGIGSGSCCPRVLLPQRADVRAGVEQHVLDPELPGLGHPPRVHALAPHAVRELDAPPAR